MGQATPPVARADLAKRLRELCWLSGSFTLRSGATTGKYFDKFLFEGEPALLGEIASQLRPLIAGETEVLAGLELGGVPLATALSIISGLPAAYVRKAPKTYGTRRLAEGAEVSGRRVLVIEDVITTGGQVAESALALRRLGAQITSVLCVVDRSGGDIPQLSAASIGVVSLFRIEELPPD